MRALIDTIAPDKRCDFVYYSVGGETDLNPHYNQNYTREEIDAILAKIKSCVEKGRFVISQNEIGRKT